MNQPEILDSDIRAMQQWLREAWRQLADVSLTAFARRELRNLRELLQQAAEQRSQPAPLAITNYNKPDLRILAW
jgi:phage shock protein A